MRRKTGITALGVVWGVLLEPVQLKLRRYVFRLLQDERLLLFPASRVGFLGREGLYTAGKCVGRDMLDRKTHTHTHKEKTNNTSTRSRLISGGRGKEKEGKKTKEEKMFGKTRKNELT